jgi:thiamine-phosphate pyrophosphorylase
LISEDAGLADAIRANGLHLPERFAASAHHWKALRPGWLITTAAHSIEAVFRAARAGADAALLAPIFPTRSHPERAALGVSHARSIAKLRILPLYALGGVNGQTARHLTGSAFVGFAAIDALSPGHKE